MLSEAPLGRRKAQKTLSKSKFYVEIARIHAKIRQLSITV
jgi:hypothetical protein